MEMDVCHDSSASDCMLGTRQGIRRRVALMTMLRDQNYRGWINHDLDTIRVSSADSWRVSMEYVTKILDPIHA